MILKGHAACFGTQGNTDAGSCFQATPHECMGGRRLVLSGSQSKHCLSLGGSSSYFYFHCDPSTSLSLLNSVIALNVRIHERGRQRKTVAAPACARRWDGNYTSGLAPWGCFSRVFSPAPCPDFVFSWAITSCSYLAVSPSAGYLLP